MFRSKLAITHPIAIKWKVKYDAVVVDCQHSLCFCGAKMKMNPLKKKIQETPSSPLVPFRAKFRPQRQLFRPSRSLAYSLVMRAGTHKRLVSIANRGLCLCCLSLCFFDRQQVFEILERLP